MSRTVIFIDNFDSFSYNLVDELTVLGNEVLVYRNDVDPKIISDTAKLHKSKGNNVVLVLSPGPSRPEDANNLLPIIRQNLGVYPMLGICLGHQALGLALGGRVTGAPQIVHGKSSMMRHNMTLCFEGLPNPLKIARYHSLIVDDLPSNVQVLSTYEEMCMCLYEPQYQVLGFQFHPESIMTTFGRKLLANALTLIAPK